MSFFREWGRFMMAGAAAHARWEMDVSNTILHDRKRLLLLALLVVSVVVGIFACQAYADDGLLPDMLGGKEAYTPAQYTTGIFLAAIFIGLIAGLITGCIGAGGGFIITPALMSFGVKGILAVGTDLFHIFAKAIMGSVIHRKLGNVAVGLAVFFVVGSLVGATVGGMINRALYDSNPILSDAFITSIYSVMLGVLGFYALTDYLKSRKNGGGGSAHGEETESEELGSLPRRMQSIKIPPMIKFDHNITMGGRRISWVFVCLTGALVGFAASIMGVGGGFLTFPVFVYTLGVSATTTVGTDIFQIIFTAGYSAIGQYAIYGFIFYTLAIGMLLGSLVGIQLGSLVTRVVPGTHIRGFYAMAVLAGFANRIFALPGKLGDLDVLPISGSAGDVLENIGIFVFFIVLGVFAVWVIGTFLRNIKKLRRVEVEI